MRIEFPQLALSVYILCISVVIQVEFSYENVHFAVCNYF